MKKLNIYLPEPVLLRLKELSEQRDTTVSEIVRRAIEEYLKKQKS